MSAAERDWSKDEQAATPVVVAAVTTEPAGLNLDGWETLPAGRVKMLRANADFIKTGTGKPYYVCRGSEWIPCDEVVINGPSALCSSQVPAHCGNSHVWLETQAEVRFLRTNPSRKK